MPKRARIGDVIEIPTSKGLAYAQYTHQHSKYGGLIRVFDSLFERRPASFAEVVSGPVRFSTFLPVRAAINRGIFVVVGHEQIAQQNQQFPIFRGGIADPKTKKVSVWWFWDGEKSWRVGQITTQERKYPLHEVWNDTFLIARIESGWSPSTDYR